MSGLELTYHEYKGLTEPVRLAFVLGGIAFEDVRLKDDQIPDLKKTGRLPFGQLPLLSVDGEDYTQEEAILRYAGILTGLYPQGDPLLALYIDEVLSALVDIRVRMFNASDPEQLKEARAKFLQDDVPRFIGGLEKIIKAKAKSETWVCGDSMSIADLELYNLIGHIVHGRIQYVPKDLFSSYPRLLASFHAVDENPKIEAWNNQHAWSTGGPF